MLGPLTSIDIMVLCLIMREWRHLPGKAPPGHEYALHG